MQIEFRPHHFLCTLCFQGKGYSLGFVANYHAIVQQLNFNEDTKIKVVAQTDSICAPCPNRKLDQCKTEEHVLQLDLAHAEALQITYGDEISWHEAKKIIKERLTMAKFHEICKSCSWKKTGICERVLDTVINHVETCPEAPF